jgi:hypothetical protein
VARGACELGSQNPISTCHRRRDHSGVSVVSIDIRRVSGSITHHRSGPAEPHTRHTRLDVPWTVELREDSGRAGVVGSCEADARSGSSLPALCSGVGSSVNPSSSEYILLHRCAPLL